MAANIVDGHHRIDDADCGFQRPTLAMMMKAT